MGKLAAPKKSVLTAFLLPGTAIYSFVIVFPLIFALIFSLYKWSGGPNKTFIGLENYVNLIKDDNFWLAFKNNVTIMILCIIFQLGISFFLAILLSSKMMKIHKFHNVSIFLPVIVSPVVVGILWKIIFNRGMIDTVMESLGLSGLVRNWLGDPKVVVYSVAAVVVWQYLGIYLMIFLSGMQGIPEELYESAVIDGASGLQKAFRITLPLMYDVIKVAVMLSIAGNMKIFDHILVMTGGGPGKSSMVLAIYAYNNSFKMFKLGYANAISIGMIILSLAIILISRKIMPSSDN
ncbi:sugar ABC transporter permease [Candidatus Nomurabacteria bacterium]|nr:sugar ABC transporter permease [Candidatus Nomurabacteria bacterium]